MLLLVKRRNKLAQMSWSHRTFDKISLNYVAELVTVVIMNSFSLSLCLG